MSLEHLWLVKDLVLLIRYEFIYERVLQLFDM